MKNLLILLLLPISLFAQDIPKGSTKIIIKNELAAKQNFDLVVKTLLDNDYFIEAKDADMLTIKTQPKPVNKHTGVYFLNIRSLDNHIEVSGMFKSGIEVSMYGVSSTDNYTPITLKGGLYKAAFNNMNNFALKLGTVSYK